MADIKKTAEHTDVWQENEQVNDERIIPESLFSFFSLHFRAWIFWRPVRNCGAKRAFKTYYIVCHPTKSLPPDAAKRLFN